MAVGNAHKFPGFLTSALTQLSLQSHRLLFSHEVRGENKPERKLASSGHQTHYQQVMSQTRSLMSHPGRPPISLNRLTILILEGFISLSSLAVVMWESSR